MRPTRALRSRVAPRTPLPPFRLQHPHKQVEDEVVGDTVLSTQQHVCELLSFCVQKHSYRIKYFILRNNVLAKVLRLASSLDKCLVLAALRFFRTCIGLKDEFYNRYIVKNKCFEPVLAQLQRNRTRDNLIHSSILELFEFIRRDNIKTLISHLSDTFVDTLAGLNHVDTFKGLLLRHEQLLDLHWVQGLQALVDLVDRLLEGVVVVGGEAEGLVLEFIEFALATAVDV